MVRVDVGVAVGVPELELVGVSVLVPLSVGVAELVGVEERDSVVEPVPESVPVFDALAPYVSDAVGEDEIDGGSVAVELGVSEDVGVAELEGVPVGVTLPVALGVTLEVSETDGVSLALAPSDTDGVAEFDSEALRVDVGDDVEEGVPVLELVDEPVVDGVPVIELVADSLAADAVEDDDGDGVIVADGEPD